MDKDEQKHHFINLAEIIADTGKLFSEYLLDPENSSFRENISKKESEGDRIEELLNEHFSQQRNIPYLSLDRAKLLDRLDEILDQLLLASKTVDTYGKYLPNDFMDNAELFASNVKVITTLIMDAVIALYEDFSEAAKIVEKIEDLRDEMTVEMFDLEKEYFESDETAENWKIFIAISRILRRTNSIIHSTKQASEMIHIMTMKYL